MSMEPVKVETDNPSPDVMTETVHYRVIQDEEIAKLHPLFQRLGWPTPDPEYAKVVVAEAGMGADAVILGFHVVQFVPHAEPLWIHPSTRGTGIAEALVEHTLHYIEHDCHIKHYICIAKPGSFAARLCDKYGFAAYPGQVYIRNVA